MKTNIAHLDRLAKTNVLTIVYSRVISTIETTCYTHDMENPVDEAIKEIDAFLKAKKMKPYRLGLLACANPKAVERVKSGKGSVETLKALVDYVREHGK